MDRLEKLVAGQEIANLRARYARFVDTKDWASLKLLFAQDVEYERVPIASTSADTQIETHRGVDTMMSLVAKATEGLSSIHHCFMPEIEVNTSDEATGVWAMSSVVRSETDPASISFEAAGYYHDNYQRLDTVWVFKKIRVVRLYTWSKEMGPRR